MALQEDKLLHLVESPPYDRSVMSMTSPLTKAMEAAKLVVTSSMEDNMVIDDYEIKALWELM